MTMSDFLDPRINAFLDDQMSPSEREAFLSLLANDASLRHELDRQQALEQSIRRIYRERGIEKAIAGIPINDSISNWPSAGDHIKSPRSIQRFLAAAALLSFSLTGVWYSWSISRPAPALDPYAPQPWRSFETVYNDAVREGFKPAWICRDERELERTFVKKVRQPLLIAALPAGVTAGGIAYSNTITPTTINVYGRVDDTPVMVFVDKLAADHGPPSPPPAGFHLFRSQIEDLVLYELTPFDRPNILPYFYKPK